MRYEIMKQRHFYDGEIKAVNFYSQDDCAEGS